MNIMNRLKHIWKDHKIEMVIIGVVLVIAIAM